MAHRSELKDVHPAVGEWLTAHGFTWKHEVPVMGGRIDFVAVGKSTGDTWVIEAKSHYGDADRIVTQVTRYRDAYEPSARMAIAIPADKLRDSLELLCRKNGIELILIEAKTALAPVDEKQLSESALLDQLPPDGQLLVLKLQQLREINPTQFEICMSFIQSLIAIGKANEQESQS